MIFLFSIKMEISFMEKSLIPILSDFLCEEGEETLSKKLSHIYEMRKNSLANFIFLLKPSSWM